VKGDFMKNFICFVLAVMIVPATLLASSPTDNGGIYDDGNSIPYYGSIWDGPKDVLFDNGPIVTSIGTGIGGADESIVDSLESTLAWNCHAGPDFKLSDDFEVPAGETWEITSITIFCYQHSGTTSSITHMFLQIFDDSPESGTVVWGNLSTNVLSSTSWMNCYRVHSWNAGHNSDSPIMVNVCEFSTPITLTEGNYWLVWMADGTGLSGPWNAPVTINGQLATGDGLQCAPTPGWYPIVDTTSKEPKGLPFILEGSILVSLENATWAGIKSAF